MRHSSPLQDSHAATATLRIVTGFGVLALLLLAPVARAADQNFTDLDNTSGSLSVTSPDSVNNTISAGSTYSNAISGTGNLHVLSGGTGNTFTIGGVQTYTGTTTFDSGTVVSLTAVNAISSSSAVTNNGVVLLNGNNQTFKNLSSASGNGNISLNGATLTANITSAVTWYGTAGNGGSAGNLIVSGSSTWTVGHAQAYTGTTEIQSGVTVAAAAANAFSTSSTFTVDTGGSFTMTSFNQTLNNLTGGGNITETTGVLTVNETSAGTYSGVITSSGAPAGGFTKTGSANLTLTGDNAYLGETLISAGTLTAGAADGQTLINSSDVNISAGATLALTGNQSINNLMSASNTSNVALGANTLTNLNGSNTTFAGVIAGSGGLTQGGGGGYLELTNDNTYTGTTTINNGATLRIDAADGNTIAASSGVAVTGTLALNNTNQSVKNISGTGAVTLGSGTLTDATTGATSYSGTMTGTGGLTVNGTGNLTVSSALAYTGATTIGSGATLTAGATGIIASSSGVTVNGTFALNNFNQTVNNIAGTGAVTLGSATLTDATTGATSYSGTMTGTGGLTVNGSGTLTVGSALAYTGATTIGSGATVKAGVTNVVSASSGVAVNGTFDLNSTAQTVKNLSGSGTINLDGSALTIQEGSNTSFTGNIVDGATAGTGLVITGASKLVLSGTNTYSGTTEIGTGTTLQIASAANLGGSSVRLDAGTSTVLVSGTGVTINKNIALNFANGTGGGTLAVANGNSDTFSGVISSANSGVLHIGAAGSTGTVVLSGTNTYTGGTNVDFGTLSIASNANLGAGTVAMATGTTLALTGATSVTNAVALTGTSTVNTNANSDTLAGVVSGTGGFIKTGTGALILNGTNTYTGTTEVAAGTLQVDGNDTASTGAVTVDSGATLKGIGTLGGNLINNGIVAPGDSPGTMTVNGNYSGSGAINEEFTGSNAPGNFDRLVITGTANISSQTLTYNPVGASPAAQYVRGTSYTILTSSALTGTFTNLPNGSVVSASSTGANAATAANIAASGSPNLVIQTTYNNTSVIATILQGQLFGSAPGLTPNERNVAAALDSLQLTTTSGPVNDLLNAVSATPIANQAAALNTLTGEVNADMQTSSLTGMHEFSGLLAKRLGGDCNTDNALNNPGSTVSSASKKMGLTGSASNASAWACGYGSFGSISGSGGSSGYNTTLAGTTMGVEVKPSSTTMVRAGFGYAHDDIGVNATSATVNTAQMGVYGQYDFLRAQNLDMYVGGTLAAGYDFINTKRQIALTNSTATATPTAYDLSTSALIGFTTNVSGVTLEPVLAEEFVFNNQHKYTEGGAGGADLTVNSHSLSSLRSSLGAQASTSFGFDNGMALTPQVHTAVIYDSFDLTPSLTESLGGAPFTVKGANPGRAGIQGGAGATLDLNHGMSAFVDYNGTFKDHETDNLVMGGIKINW